MVRYYIDIRNICTSTDFFIHVIKLCLNISRGCLSVISTLDIGKYIMYYNYVLVKTANINKAQKTGVYPDLSSLKVACCR